MADYISREAMHKANQDEWQGVYGFVDCDIFEDNENMIDRVPSADVRPVVKAHWIYHEHDYGDYYECSHCHDEYVVYERDMYWKHCPNCGADMTEDKNDQRGEKDGG